MGKYWDLITHPVELRAVIQWAVFHEPLHARDKASETPKLKRCYELLEASSRSFCMVIQQLQPELRVAVLSRIANLGHAFLSRFTGIRYRRRRHDVAY